MKKLVFVLPALLLLACLCPASTLTPTTPTRVHNQPTAVSQDPELLISSERLTVVRLHKSGGDLTSQLQAEAPKAAALGQRMFVEFDASW
jgi:hypothetical protein